MPLSDLGDVEVLRSEANRLLPTSPKAVFVKSFTEQWLETKRLEDIMPDRALKFSRQDQNQSKLEVEYFFAEIHLQHSVTFQPESHFDVLGGQYVVITGDV